MEKSSPKSTTLPIALSFPQTTITLGNFQFLASSGELFNHVDDGLEMWTGEGDRIVTEEIVFAKPFKASPIISLGLTGMDCAHDQNLRFRLSAVNVSNKGFTIEFLTWEDTHFARASISWQAVGEV